LGIVCWRGVKRPTFMDEEEKRRLDLAARGYDLSGA
jgi:hypothetical protein